MNITQRVTRALFVFISTFPLVSLASVDTFYDYELYTPDGKVLQLNALPSQITQSSVILVGEYHSHSAIHRFQSDLYRQLLASNKQVSLSMEQFSRPAQTVIDQYLESKIGELALISHGNAWPNYTSDYRALIEQAKASNNPVIAANAPRDIVSCIGIHGLEYLDTLTDPKRAHVANQVMTVDGAYKQRFYQAMQGLPDKQIETMFQAQMTWDETMAESIVQHLESKPDHQILHIAGNFHIENGEGIASSITRRKKQVPLSIISPVYVVSDQARHFQLLVLPIPDQTIQERQHHSISHAGDDQSRSSLCEPAQP